MWASEIRPIAGSPGRAWVKKISRLMPMMISGVTIGSRMSVSAAPLPRNRSRASPKPRSDPRTVATTTATAATMSEVWSESSRSLLASSFGYQSRVNPCHTNVRRESLKLKITRTTIGANRKA